MNEKPTLYQYCMMRQHPSGGVQYIHGSSERHPPLATNDDYNDFVERLANSLGYSKDGLTVLSLTRL